MPTEGKQLKGGTYFMTELEFGVKLKQIREGRGMTQQVLAEKLYVTRQAVSRWERGTRYPELLTAKKITKILNVSLDELLSGEELRENIVKEPILKQPIENIVQTMLYMIAVIIYLLLCIFSIYSFLQPNKTLINTPSGKMSLITISSDAIKVIHLTVSAIGLILSVKNKLRFCSTVHICNECPIIFTLKERRIPVGIIIGICLVTIGYLILGYTNRLLRITDLDFNVTTTHMIGKTCMSVLLGYQAYVWYKKKWISHHIS